MNKSDKLKGYLTQYPFLQNKWFCKELGIAQQTLKSWLRNDINKRNLSEETAAKYLPLIENIHFAIQAYKQS